MRRITVGSLALVVVVFHLCAFSASALQSCPAPPIPAPAKDNIFTEEQENHLGDALAEQLERDYRVIADDEIRAELQRIGELLLKQIPPSGIRFQFYLVDLPVANAFTLPGGRIYVTRKLVAYAHSEDELAGVLSHEIGHGIARDTAVAASRLFRDILKVTSVGDRKDVFEKLHLLTENAMRNPRAFERLGTKHSEQIEADQLGLYIMARAGYSPERYIEFWDRYAETKGKKGNWLTDVFGATRPESRRLREMSRLLATLPRECVAGGNTLTAGQYKDWQSAVVAYTGLGLRESLPGLIMRKQLDPPLRGDVTHLRFSPDGTHILAQDDSGITILSREPFQPLFHIDAPEAFPAQFSPDSKNVVFHNATLRVESWSVEEEQRASAHEVVLSKPCLQTLLSPDGKLLACYGVDLDLRLISVESGESVFQKKDFYIPNGLEYFIWVLNWGIDESFQAIKMGFSPDMRYFLAARESAALALDLNGFTNVTLPSALKRVVSGGFVFLDAERVIGVNKEKYERSGVARFPSGEMLNEIALGEQALAAPGKGNYVLLRPISKYPVGIMNLETKKIFMANKNSAIDIYDKVFVVEYVTGELALHSGDSENALARTTLPRASLGAIRAIAVSKDMAWLAVSQRSRGAVWDLAAGKRIFHVRGFRGAHFDGDMLYADFPKFQESERMIGQLSLSRRLVLEGPKVTEARAGQYGPYLLLTKPAKKDGRLDKDIMLEVLDARTTQTIWSRHFPREAPSAFVDSAEGTLVLLWLVSENHAREAIKADPELKQRLAAMKEKEGDYYMEMVNARDGKMFGRLLVETGKRSFRVRGAFVHGDWVVITDNNNRVLVYSLSTGELKGRVFGSQAAIAKSTGLLVVENVPGKLTLYDLATLEKREEYTFSSPVSMARFSDDGKRLFVLTASQTVHWITLTETVTAEERAAVK